MECGAGSSLANAVTAALDGGLTGLEWAAGIPGSVAGAIRGNAGAFGGWISDIAELAEVYDMDTGSFRFMPKLECEFKYRDSIFKSDKLIIWNANFLLKKGVKKNIKEEMALIIKKRAKMQPKQPSAGSVFKNFSFAYLKNRTKNWPRQLLMKMSSGLKWSLRGG